MTETDPIPLSALQHWAYCPRQCGLIHLEQAFADKIRIARGLAAREEARTYGRYVSPDDMLKRLDKSLAKVRAKQTVQFPSRCG
jgi:CRISPR-associated exonuclease Cas4